MGCYISNLQNLNMIYDTYFFILGDYSNHSFVNDIYRNDFRTIADRIGGRAVIVGQHDQVEHDLMHALINYPDYDLMSALAAFSEHLPGLLIIDRRSLELLMEFSASYRTERPSSELLNIVFIPFELMEQAYSSPNILIRDLADYAFQKNNLFLQRTLHANAHVRTMEKTRTFNNRWGERSYRTAMWGSADFLADLYDERTLCYYVETALSHILRNPRYHGMLENPTNDVLRDQLQMVYPIYDQPRQGTSESSHNAGQPDFLITDPYNFPHALMEAMYLDSLDSPKLSRHFLKTLVNYDPQGLDVDFVVCYVRCADFPAFSDKLQQWLNNWHFPYERLTPARAVPGPFAEMCHFSVTLCRQRKPFNVHTYAIHLPL